MSDGDGSAEGLAGEQVEGESAVGAPERFHGQAEVDELIDQHPQIEGGRPKLLQRDGVAGIRTVTHE